MMERDASMLRMKQLRILLYDAERIGARLGKNVFIPQNVRDTKLRQPALPGTKKITGTAKLEIEFRDGKTVLRLHHRRETLLGVMVERQRRVRCG